jgi:hypothetical protein
MLLRSRPGPPVWSRKSPLDATATFSPASQSTCGRNRSATSTLPPTVDGCLPPPATLRPSAQRPDGSLPLRKGSQSRQCPNLVRSVELLSVVYNPNSMLQKTGLTSASLQAATSADAAPPIALPGPQLRNVRSLDRVQEEEEPTAAGRPRGPSSKRTDKSKAVPISQPSQAAIAQEQAACLPDVAEPPKAPQVSGTRVAPTALPIIYPQQARPSQVPTRPLPVPASFPILSPLLPRELDAVMVMTALQLVVGSSYTLSGTFQSKLPGPSVLIRLTRDRWTTQTDFLAEVAAISGSLFRFSAAITGKPSDQISMAIKMFSSGTEVWDANNGQNYTLALPPLQGTSVPESAPAIVEQPPTPSRQPEPEEFPLRHKHSGSRDSTSSFYSATSANEREEQDTPLTTPPSSDVSSNVKRLDAVPPRITLIRTESEAGLSNEPDMPDHSRSEAKASTASGAASIQLESQAMNRDASGSSSSSSSSKRNGMPRAVAYPPTMTVPSAPIRVPASTIRQQLAVAQFEKAKAQQFPEPHSAPESSSRPASVNSASTSRSSSTNEPFTWKKQPSSAGPTTFPAAATPKQDSVGGLGQLYDASDFETASRISRARSFERRLDGPAGHERSKSTYASSIASRGSSAKFDIPQGYRSMSVRRNPIRPNWSNDAISNPQTTMCAITLARNAFAPAGRSKLFSSKKSREEASFQANRPRTWADVKFTEATEPPSKLKSTELLVQVTATGLDFWDAARVDTLIRRGDGYGFVPGRSFVGRVLQTGLDVKLKVGDFVYGLNDLAKVSLSSRPCDTLKSVSPALWPSS